MTLDALMPFVLVALAFVPGVVAWVVTARFGGWCGLVVPVAVVGVALWRSQSGIGHAEEVMGRGLEMVIFWVPVGIIAWVGFGIGLASHRARKAAHRPPR